MRYLATPYYRGIRGKTKLMPNASKKSFREAVLWETEQVEILKALAEQTGTVCLTVLDWSDRYLDYVQKHFVKDTYLEKRAAFKRFVAMDKITESTLVSDITRPLAAAFLDGQMGIRSGFSINRDRKNMSAAWTYGKGFIEGFPLVENPFSGIPKKPEIRRPRYVPPVADFWKVYDHVAAKAAETGQEEHIQDQIMLRAYLHLAARRTELFKVKWSDVEFHNGQIRLGTRKRKGGLEYDWLPLSNELHADLLMWAERRLAHCTMDKEHLFVCLSDLPCNDQYYGLPFRERRWAMGRWCKRVEVKPFGWHAIRHLTASELYRLGYPKSMIQQILRHKSATTTDIYLRSLGTASELRETINNGLRRNNVIPFGQKKMASSDGA
jgi:integrase